MCIRDSAGELARVEGKSSSLMNGQRNLLENLGDIADIIELVNFLKDLFEQPLPGKEYRITGVCEPTTEDNPNQPSTSVFLPEEMWADRVVSLGDMMPDLLQAHLGYRTPTCGSSPKPTLGGTWVSTRWVSDGNSDNGTKPLRKLFRYRSKSTRTADELQKWWAPFTWTSGSTIVEHRGAWWGVAQVWASDADEGKRVIRFAGTEAGLDPDKNGEWSIKRSSHPRYGMSDTMRLAKTRGEYWATRREGASGLPEL